MVDNKLEKQFRSIAAQTVQNKLSRGITAHAKHIQLQSGMKEYVKMFNWAVFDSVMELKSEPFDTMQEAEHFSAVFNDCFLYDSYCAEENGRYYVYSGSLPSSDLGGGASCRFLFGRNDANRFLTFIIQTVIAYFLNRSKLDNFRIPRQKPTLDDRISVGHTVACGYLLHIAEFLVVGQSIFFGSVSKDIFLHVLVGQPLIGLLLCILANLALNDLIVGIILTNPLEARILLARGVCGKLGENTVHDDGTIGVVDGEFVSHKNSPFKFIDCLICWDLGQKSGSILRLLLRLLLRAILGNLLQELIALVMEALDFRVGHQEPILDIGIGEGISLGRLAIFANGAHVLIRFHLGAILVVVSDVLLHVLVGQALELGLRALLLDGHNAVARVVAASLLKLLILVRAELGGSGSEGLVDFEGAGLVVDGDVRHIVSLSGFVRFSFLFSFFRVSVCFPHPVTVL